jgi:hypothetical protein
MEKVGGGIKERVELLLGSEQKEERKITERAHGE